VPRSRSVVAETFRVAAMVCVVCAVLVSTAAVTLRDRQRANAELDRKKNVLAAAGVIEAGSAPSADEIERRFADFSVVVVDLETGDPDPSFDATGYDPREPGTAPGATLPRPPNEAQVREVPRRTLVYERRDDAGRLELLVLPIEGQGLWARMYGYLALGPDLSTVRGLTYYQHGETPGLGGEVDNPRWRARWPGRQAFDDEGQAAIEVIRGAAGPPEDDPYRVDGLSGATITSRGVTAMLHFWLGELGFGPYLDRLRKEDSGGEAS